MRSESSSVATGRVPGMRLASAQNALRAFPGGKRKGAVDESGAQVQLGTQGASRDVEPRHDRAAEETDCKRCEGAEPKP